MPRTYCHDCYNYHDSVVCPHKNLPFCPDCQKYHAKGMCAENYHAVEPVKPAPRIMPKITKAFDDWTAIYERNLHEFATETGGVPTAPMIRRAEELADREIKLLFQRP